MSGNENLNLVAINGDIVNKSTAENIDHVGTQAQNTKLIYNDVENMNKSAVALNNSYSSSSKSSGISTEVTINYNHGFQTEANAVSISASKSKMNSNGTTYQNGRFVNVNE
ncbi:hemagglutinin repeat-containing protein, partial [Fusobacterium necrophorum]|uniref:hemagglutinin repeat-containing protein n=1 Tax=Fusobacterium necrophorum TaxID=859 RepID=UPI00164E959E